MREQTEPCLILHLSFISSVILLKFHKCSESLNEDSRFNVVTHSGKSIQINYAREEEPTCKFA